MGSEDKCPLLENTDFEMIRKIENAFLQASVRDFGAELQSVINKKNHDEYIWQGQKSIWPRHSPILFPIVGELKNGFFWYEKQKYFLNRHGFARDMRFEMVDFSANKVIHQLMSTEKTRSIFPFDFEFFVGHTLHEKELSIEFIVKNKGNKMMPFSLGAHPAFTLKAPLDAEILFDKKTKNNPQILKDGLVSDKSVPLVGGESLSIDKSTFNQDALLFINTDIKEAILFDHGQKRVKLSFRDMPFLGIWSKPKAPFVCIEPWQGIADDVHSKNDLFDKKGIQILAPKSEHFCTYKITFYEATI